MTTTLRAMTPDDYEAVSALWQASPGVGLGESDGAADVASFLRRNPGMSCVAIAHDGRLVGAVLCGHDGRRGYLHHLAVADDVRRRGIARCMIAFCFERLAEARIPKCNVFLFTDNTAAEQFWLHNGWAARPDLKVMQKRTGPVADA